MGRPCEFKSHWPHQEKEPSQQTWFFLCDLWTLCVENTRTCGANSHCVSGAHSPVQARSFHYLVALLLASTHWPHQNRKRRTQCSSFFLLLDCGDTQLCCVQPCCCEPRNRAGVHSFVQAHSFHYYCAWTRLQLPRISTKQKRKRTSIACFFVYMTENMLRGVERERQ